MGDVGIGSVVGYLELDDKLTSGMAQASRTMASYQSKFTSIGKTLSLAVSGPLLAVGGASVAAAASFESSMKKVITLGGSTAKQVAEVRDEVLKLARDTGIGAKELGDAMFFISSAGFRGAEGVKMLESAAKASAIGMGSTAVIADALTSSLNAYGKSGLTAAGAMDVLVRTVQEGKMPVEDLAGSLGKVLATASLSGVSFAELGAWIATLTRQGVNAQMATMSLNAVLQTFVKPTKQAEEALARFNLSGAKMREMIQKEGLLKSLTMLTEAFKDDDEAMTQVVGNVRAWRGVMATVGTQAETYAGILKSTSTATGSLDTAFKTTADGFGFAIKQIKAGIEDAAIKLGTVLIPMLKDVAKFAGGMTDKLAEAADWFAKLPAPIRQTAEALGLVLIVAPPVAFALGKIAEASKLLMEFTVVKALIGPIISFVAGLGELVRLAGVLGGSAALRLYFANAGAAITEIGIAIKAFGASFWVFFTNPLTIAIAAVVALVAAVRYFTGSWKDTLAILFPPIAFLQKAWEQLKAAFTEISNFLGLKQIFQDLVTVVGYGFTEALSSVKEWFKSLMPDFSWLSDAFTALGDLWDKWTGKIKSSLSTDLANFLVWLNSVVPGISLLAMAVANMAGEAGKMKDGMHAAAEGIRELEKARADAEAKMKPHMEWGNKYANGIVGMTTGQTSVAGWLGQQKPPEMGDGGIPIPQERSLAAVLEEVKKQYVALTPVQMANIKAGLTLGKTNEAIAGSARTTADVVEYYKDRLREQEKAATAAEKPLDNLKKRVRELAEAYSNYTALPSGGGVMTQEWIEDNADALLKASRDAQAFGVVTSAAFDKATQAAAQYALKSFQKERLAEFVESNKAAAKKILDAEHSKNQAIQEGIANNFKVYWEYSEKVEGLGKSEHQLRLSNIDKEEKAMIAQVANFAKMQGISAEMATEVIKKFYQHQRDLALGTQNTIVERMRAAGIATREDLLRTANEAVRDFQQMEISGEFTAESLSKAFQDANVKMAAAFGITADAINALAGFFQKLGQSAQGTLGSILGGIGGVVQNLAAAREASIKWGQAQYTYGTMDPRQGEGPTRTVSGYAPGKWGVASPLFSSKATSSEKWAAGIQSAAAIGQGAMNVWSATSAHKTALGNAGAGAMAGAQAGAAFGPWGMAIGAAAGFVTGLIRGKPQWSKIQDEMAAKYGLKISDETAKAIEKVSKEKFKGDTFSGSQYMLGDMIKESGGVTTSNYDVLMKKYRDTFSFVEMGKFTKEQANKVITDSFDEFQKVAVEKAKQTGGILDKSFREFVALDKRFGTANEKVAEFMKAQTQASVESLNGYFSILPGIKQSISDTTSELESLREELGNTTEGTKEWEDIAKKIADTSKALKDYTQVAEVMKVNSESAANGISAMINAQYNALIAGGATVREAIAAIAPSIDELSKQMDAAGIASSPVFDALKEKLALAQDTFAGPLFDAIGGLTGSMAGLFNTGELTAEMFTGVTTQVGQMWSAMEEQGKATPAAMAMIQPQLQAMWEVWKDTGWAVDDVTQKLLEDAEAAGTVGEKHKSVNDQMLDATNRIATAVEGLAEAFGVKLPKAAQDGARGITSAFDGVRVDIPVNLDYGDSPNPQYRTAEYHHGGMVKAAGASYWAGGESLARAHSGLFVGTNLGPGEVPIIAKQGEGILSNDVGVPAMGKWALETLNRGGVPSGGRGSDVDLAALVAAVSGSQNRSLNVNLNLPANTTAATREYFAREGIPALVENIRDDAYHQNEQLASVLAQLLRDRL